MTTLFWILHDAAGVDLSTSETFDSIQEAEAWMGTEWSALRAEGADSVSLVSDGSVVYKMSLQEG